MRSARRLVVNADDLGFVESVNRGIIQAADTGIVTSASLMVNTPGTDDAIRRLATLRARGRSVGVGLHLNIVAGTPLTRAASLTRSGRFLPLPALAWRAWRGQLDLGAVADELEAQLGRATALLDGVGIRVTHIDSHRHAHCLPGVWDLVVRAARAHGIPHVRHPNERPPTLLGRPHAVAAIRILRLLIGERAGIDDIGFSGIALMRSRTLDADLLALLDALPAGTTELMVHPGYDSPELAAIDRYRAPRARELRALTSPALRSRLAELDVELVTFGAPATAPAA